MLSRSRYTTRAGPVLACCIVLLATTSGRASAQADETPRDSASAEEGEERGNSLIPLPVLFYQPETGLGFGVTGVYFLRSGDPAANSAAESQRQASNISAVALYTVKKQIILSMRTELYPNKGDYRILGEASLIKFPTILWGIGNNTPDALEEDYTPLTLNTQAEVQKRFARGWYAGVLGQLGYRELRDIEDDGLLASGLVPGAEDGWVVGLGVLLTRDTRSSTVYPHRGGFHQLRAVLYSGYFGSDYDFGRISLDLREYLPVLTRHVLALRALGVFSPGDPPFDLMPQLGGDILLRGYFAGRYRDRDLLAFQAEYRMPVWWRFGVVAFGAIGQVQHDLNGFRADRFHPSLGAGLRFTLSPAEELNIRADFGWGFDVNDGGFYLSFGEAF